MQKNIHSTTIFQTLILPYLTMRMMLMIMMTMKMIVIRVLDSAGSTLVEWGRQQQHDDCYYKSNVDERTDVEMPMTID